jgi:carotenoid cleavage dioxygenase
MTAFAVLDRFYLPVQEEIQADLLPVDGELPRELNGLYVRNGPNPREGTAGHLFFGEGMLHGVWLDDGRARYANRSIPPNTSVVSHAGRILALMEVGLPWEVRSDLVVAGAYDFAGRLTTPMTAHPKISPTSGEMHFFGAQWQPGSPALTYHRATASGELVESRAIPVPGHTMMHDFALTEHYAVFFDLPVVFDRERLEAGSMPFRWSDTYGARFGVMALGGFDVRWFDVEPCYMFHVLNAYEADGRLIVDGVRYAELWRDRNDTFEPASLHRWSLGLNDGSVREAALDDAPIEFPRLNESRVGLPHRYGCALRSSAGAAGAIVKYDLAGTTATLAREFGSGRAPGEPVFVAAAGAAAEDDGWLLTYVYDAERDASDLAVLAARDLGVVATVHLPQRVPFGFHGAWVDAGI